MTDLIINFIKYITGSVTSELPVYSLSDSSYYSITNGMQTIVDFLAEVNFLIPLNQICIMVGIDLGIRLFKFIVFAINWLIRRIFDVIP